MSAEMACNAEPKNAAPTTQEKIAILLQAVLGLLGLAVTAYVIIMPGISIGTLLVSTGLVAASAVIGTVRARL